MNIHSNILLALSLAALASSAGCGKTEASPRPAGRTDGDTNASKPARATVGKSETAASEWNPQEYINEEGWDDAPKKILDDSSWTGTTTFLNRSPVAVVGISGFIRLMTEDGFEQGQVPFRAEGILPYGKLTPLKVVAGRPKVRFDKSKFVATRTQTAPSPRISQLQPSGTRP